MTDPFHRARRAAIAILTVFTFGLMVQPAMAQVEFSGETYTPGVWIDPDGCEHWVMDDGVEGYMTPHLTRDGRPVCHQADLCALLAADTLFATDRASIGPANRAAIEEFFRTAGARGYMIYGHTDSRASEAYNKRLSQRRAQAVADIGQATGALVITVQGHGETRPVASNETAAGRAKNRRVEIICIR